MPARRDRCGRDNGYAYGLAAYPKINIKFATMSRMRHSRCTGPMTRHYTPIKTNDKNIKEMYNFEFKNPVKLIFGKGTIARIAEEIPARSKVMLTFGGGSVKRNGVYEQVMKALAGRDVVEFWGIEPNPKYETLVEAISMARREGVDFLLAVGGGSVIDGTKFIAAAIPYEGEAWDIITRHDAVTKAVPLATVLTLPATGSEMNNGAVISRRSTHEKFPFHSDLVYPRFSVLDPCVTFSLPKKMVAAGLADTFVHVMEQYMTYPVDARVMDRWAEGLLQTVMEISPAAMSDEPDYDTMANFMLCATMGLNGFIAMGVPQDWATHMIGHELTALHEITHGVTLAIVLPQLLRVMRDDKHDKLLQYAERVLGITDGDDESRIDDAIRRTEEYFHSLGIATRLSDYGVGQNTVDEIVRRFTERGAVWGERNDVTPDKVRMILEKAL